ncbi:MAG TPA: dTDP-4-dehydrorhamnose 3,5-epimerase family protein [candidate division Zixibacteria bacterium]|nr:dTDP-4-dehydrorhamnose 3,5-epimerase family protein [candidate division Zixibacteria bacterium]
MIDGVKTKSLRVIPDERGKLMEILRADDELFERFGQVYITTIYPGVVKAWHCHAKQTDHFTVISGMAKLALADLRESSPTRGKVQEFFIGVDNPQLVKIPPGVYHGLKGIGASTAIALNVPTEVYHYDNPDEIRLPWNSDKIPYDWEIMMG